MALESADIVLAGKSGAHYKQTGRRHLRYEELFVPDRIVEIRTGAS
jgi:hypothetical protein